MKLSDDLPSAWIYVKAGLFLLSLVGASVFVIIAEPIAYRVMSLLIVIWSSARLYYFLFYVIENYLDEDFKFTGLGSVIAFMMRKR